MTPLSPNYFRKFSCIAAACPDPCCRAGWLIPVDSETLDFYLTAEPSVKQNTLSVDGDTVFKLRHDRSCPYFTDGGLCGIYISTGRMCEICTQYPRFYEEYDGFAEAGISCSCPEAARLILSADRASYGDLKRNTPDELLDFLVRARASAMDMAYSESSPEEAVSKLVGFGYDLQQLIDYGELELLDQLDFCAFEDPLPGFLKDIRKKILTDTEILDPRWEAALRADPKKPAASKTERRAYLGYLIFRHFLKAISTEDIFAQSLIIAAMYGLAATLTPSYAENVLLISRELEHDAENMRALRGG